MVRSVASGVMMWPGPGTEPGESPEDQTERSGGLHLASRPLQGLGIKVLG